MPDTVIHTGSAAQSLTKYGRMRLNYLKRHKPLVYNKLLESGELHSHCLKIQQQAEQSLKSMMDFFLAEYSQLKAKTDRRVWNKLLTLHRAMAREIVRDNLIHRYF